MSDALRRTIRSALQLVASGALTAAVNAWAGGLSPAVTVEVLAGWKLVVTFAQNWLEDNTQFPAVLKAVPSGGLNPVTEDPAGVPDIVIQSVAKQPAKKTAAKKKPAP